MEMALLLIVTVTQYAYDPLCALIPGMEHAQAGLFYVLRGIEGLALFLVIGRLRPALWPICIWGATEEGETAVCRLAQGPLDGTSHAAPWSGLCGDLSQLPVYMLGVFYLVLLLTRETRR